MTKIIAKMLLVVIVTCLSVGAASVASPKDNDKTVLAKKVKKIKKKEASYVVDLYAKRKDVKIYEKRNESSKVIGVVPQEGNIWKEGSEDKNGWIPVYYFDLNKNGAEVAVETGYTKKEWFKKKQNTQVRAAWERDVIKRVSKKHNWTISISKISQKSKKIKKCGVYELKRGRLSIRVKLKPNESPVGYYAKVYLDDELQDILYPQPSEFGFEELIDMLKSYSFFEYMYSS